VGGGEADGDGGMGRRTVAVGSRGILGDLRRARGRRPSFGLVSFSKSHPPTPAFLAPIP